MRAPRLLLLAFAAGSLAIAGCQGSPSVPQTSLTPPSSAPAHLTITNGAYQVEVMAGRASQSAAVLASSSRSPTSYSVVATPEGTYSVRFAAGSGGAQSWTVRLSPKPSWEVVVQGGTTHLVLDLSGLKLRSLAIAGGAYTMVIDLPPAQGDVPVEVTGGANRITFVVPGASSATLLAGPGVSRVQGGIPEGSRRYVVGSSSGAAAGYQIRVTSGAALVVLSTG